MSEGGHSLPKTREVFPVEVVRQFRRQALAVRRTLRNSGPHEWCRVDFDAEALIAVFPSLVLRAGYRLLTYYYHSNGNGNGVVVAFPEASDTYRALAAVPVGTPISWPPTEDTPIGPMEVIEGDGSALAYLSASLLMRELREVGAEWHGVDWEEREVMAPTRTYLAGRSRTAKHNQSLQNLVDELEWPQGKLAIESLAPEVRFDDQVVQVVFHTYTEMGRQHVTRWTDVYTDSYAPACESEEAAVGGPGFVF
jgi:hypothetical protein